jgi:hypothetical protein
MNSIFVLADTDINLSNNGMSSQFNVEDTAGLFIEFVPVDYTSNILPYQQNSLKNILFINRTYPLADDEINLDDKKIK